MMDKRKQELLKKAQKAIQRRHLLGVKARSGAPVAQPAPKPIRINNVNRPLRVHRQASSIFISGNIGDVFALESFMMDDERKNLNAIFYGTRARNDVESLFKAIPMPSLRWRRPRGSL
jgi:hypothetical protein